MGINFQSPMPLYKQIAADLKAKIARGDLRVGDQVGSHNELSRFYNVSVITVKKALSDLIAEGYLYGRVGKGTFVAHQSPKVDVSQHKTIGFVLRDLKNPFFSLIAHGAAKAADEHGYHLLLASSVGRLDKEERQIAHFQKIGVKGLIIASMSRTYRASDEIRRLHEAGFPYAMVSFVADPDIWYVGINHEQGAFAATTHLIDLGHQRIGYINGGKANLLSDLREAGYMRAMQTRHLSYRYVLTIDGTTDRFDAGYNAGKKFLKSALWKSAQRPEAFFAYSDLVALGFLRAMEEAGVRVPEDLAMIGYDDIEQAQYATSPLTTLHQPTEEIGKIATEIVINRIENKPAAVRTILDFKLAVRASCGALIKNDRRSPQASATAKARASRKTTERTFASVVH